MTYIHINCVADIKLCTFIIFVDDKQVCVESILQTSQFSDPSRECIDS